MARFQFRLQSLLTLRESQRDLRRSELAEALAAERRLLARRTLLERELASEHDRARTDAAPGRLDVANLAAARRYAALLREQLGSLVDEAVAQAAEVERRRLQLVEADRQVRVLEKLRDRRHQQFQAQTARDESKQSDELARQSVRRQSAS